MPAYIVRCKCSTARVEEVNEWVSAAMYQVYAFERLPNGFNRNAPFFCTWCNRYYKVTPIKGRVTEHVCNAKCTASKGPSCKCSCGGKNHGRAYA